MCLVTYWTAVSSRWYVRCTVDRWQLIRAHRCKKFIYQKEKMGNSFGNYGTNGYNLYFHPEIQPDPTKEPTFDSNLGFPNGRKERSKFM